MVRPFCRFRRCETSRRNGPITHAVARLFAPLAGKTAAQLLTGTRLQTHAHRFEHLATTIYRETGLATRGFSAAGQRGSYGNPGYEVSLLLTETYARYAARPLARKTFDHAAFEQSVRATLTQVSNGQAPANDFGWSLREFTTVHDRSAGLAVRSSAVEAANVLLTEDGSRKLFAAFNQFTATTLSPSMLKVAARIDEKTAASAVEAFESKLLARRSSSRSMVPQPLTARDKQALTDFALGRKPAALLRDTRSWFKDELADKWSRQSLAADMQAVAQALVPFVKTIEPGLGQYVGRGQGQANINSLPTPAWHTDSPNRPAEGATGWGQYLLRAVVATNTDGPLGMVNGKVIAAKQGQLMIGWGEPMRLLDFAHRQPLMHTSPFINPQGRTVGLAGVISTPMSSSDLVSRAEWGTLKPSKP